MPFKITDDNYRKYKAIFEIAWGILSIEFPDTYLGEKSPIFTLNSFEKESLAKAKKSLKIGLVDLIVMIDHCEIELKNRINVELKNKDLPNLFLLNGIIRDSISKILKRGRLNNDNEYYTAKEYLDNIDSEISDIERKHLSEIFFNHETKK